MIKHQAKLIRDKIVEQGRIIRDEFVSKSYRKPRGYWVTILQTTQVGQSFVVMEHYTALNLKVIAKKLGMRITQYKEQGYWRITRVK